MCVCMCVLKSIYILKMVFKSNIFTFFLKNLNPLKAGHIAILFLYINIPYKTQTNKKEKTLFFTMFIYKNKNLFCPQTLSIIVNTPKKNISMQCE